MKAFNRSLLAATIAAAALLPVAGVAMAQDDAATPAAAPRSAITPDAAAALQRMKDYLGKLKAFQVDADISRDEVLPYGYKLQHNERTRMIVQRPNRFRIDVDGDLRHRRYYYDGATLTTVAPDANVYAKFDAPDNVNAVVTKLLDMGAEMPLVDVLRQGFGGTLLDGVRVGLVVGESPVEGVTTQQVAFRQAPVDWQIWITPEGQPRKIVITTRYEVGDPQYQAVLHWDTTPSIASNTFRFSPAKDMREIPFNNKAEVAAATAGGTP
ncbi:DUF2092 domain-containing protein [Lysobacter sp. TY2-98]|uniref:DUF2092 domain-containing protein n=1 Tax=Lysobacter sp. TY2-98 TaxID=2290922 RepID=UPI000E203930|nr:DUF2092 domain-containing protein [Lysobacter sp. TY2-98]AXK71775.1 DUF2092 domain-containing protein [Lysobacter sp. TY2-98]